MWPRPPPFPAHPEDSQEPGQSTSHASTGTSFRQKQPLKAGVAVVTSRCLRRNIRTCMTTLKIQVFDTRLPYLMSVCRGWRNTLAAGMNFTLESSFTAWLHSIGTCRVGLQVTVRQHHILFLPWPPYSPGGVPWGVAWWGAGQSSCRGAGAPGGWPAAGRRRGRGGNCPRGRRTRRPRRP